MSDPRPQKRQPFGVIDCKALPALSTLPIQHQFKALVGEFLAKSPCNGRALRIGLIDWMRESLSTIDPELVPPPQPPDLGEALRVYARGYYQTHREHILAARRERYRQRARREFGV